MAKMVWDNNKSQDELEKMRAAILAQQQNTNMPVGATKSYDEVEAIRSAIIANQQGQGTSGSLNKLALPQSPVVMKTTQPSAANNYMPSVAVQNNTVAQPQQSIPQGVAQNTQQQSNMNPYADKIDALMNEIMNQKAFSYDAESDPLYASYKKRYKQAGEESFQNTIGDLVGMTGGRLNSWATSAASQARQSWDNKLMDTIPELYNLAYSMYKGGNEDKYSQLNALRGLDNTQYQRQYTEGRDAIGDQRYDTEWNYGVGRDAIADERYDDTTTYNRNVDTREWEHDLNREQINDDRYANETAYSKEQDAKKWDYGVSQDEYNKATSEEQKAYDRYWDSVKWDYGTAQDSLNRQDDLNYKGWQMSQAEKKSTEDAPATATQLANYQYLMDKISGSSDTTEEMLRNIDKNGKDFYVSLIGQDLYNQMVQEVSGGVKQASNAPGIAGSLSDFKKTIDNMANIEEDITYSMTGQLSEDTKQKVIDYLMMLEENGVKEDIINGLLVNYGLPLGY